MKTDPTKTATEAEPVTAATASPGLPSDQTAVPLPTRPLGVLLLTAGIIGFVAAFVLSVEKFLLLTNPFYAPTCNVSASLNCGSVMSSPQSEVFGFPNPLLGIAGFAIVATTGAALLAQNRLATWYWVGLQVGATAAVVFIHWLIIQSVFAIGALCPYCMAVWAVTIPTFFYVTMHNLSQIRTGPRGHSIINFIRRYHSALLGLWILAIIILVAQQFWFGN